MTEPLPAVEVEVGPDPRSSVIWLHGLGADGHDFEPIVGELAALPVSVRYVFPHAPMRPVTINGGAVMRAWYDVVSFDLIRREDERGVRESQLQLEALIAREESRGIPRRCIVLAGFSQGGAIVLHTALRQATGLAGVIALSTYLPVAEKASSEATIAGRSIPIFFAHGIYDPIVSIAGAVASRDKLLAMGCRVEWHQYPMQHSVCPEEIVHLRAWLAAALSAAAAA